MSVTGAIVLYATLWFLVLFVLLPFGEQSQAEAGEIVPGTHAGAPHNPALKRKAIWATILSAIIFAVIVAVIWSGWITREDILGFGYIA